MTTESGRKQQLTAGINRHVVLELVSGEGVERMEFDIVPDQYADIRQGYLGINTPLAKAIQGGKAGQALPYTSGGAMEVRLISVDLSQNAPSKEIAERRQETYRRAIDNSDRTNAMIFASSFSGKWGDYDPTGFTEEAQEEKGDSPREEDHSH